MFTAKSTDFKGGGEANTILYHNQRKQIKEIRCVLIAHAAEDLAISLFLIERNLFRESSRSIIDVSSSPLFLTILPPGQAALHGTARGEAISGYCLARCQHNECDWHLFPMFE